MESESSFMLLWKYGLETMGSDHREEDCSLTLGSTLPCDSWNAEWATGDAQLETALTLGQCVVERTEHWKSRLY